MVGREPRAGLVTLLGPTWLMIVALVVLFLGGTFLGFTWWTLKAHPDNPLPPIPPYRRPVTRSYIVDALPVHGITAASACVPGMRGDGR